MWLCTFTPIIQQHQSCRVLITTILSPTGNKVTWLSRLLQSTSRILVRVVWLCIFTLITEHQGLRSLLSCNNTKVVWISCPLFNVVWFSYPLLYRPTAQIYEVLIPSITTHQHYACVATLSTLLLTLSTPSLCGSYTHPHYPTTPTCPLPSPNHTKVVWLSYTLFFTQQHKGCVAPIPILLSPSNTMSCGCRTHSHHLTTPMLGVSYIHPYHPTTPTLCGSHSHSYHLTTPMLGGSHIHSYYQQHKRCVYVIPTHHLTTPMLGGSHIHSYQSARQMLCGSHTKSFITQPHKVVWLSLPLSSPNNIMIVWFSCPLIITQQG